MCGFCFIRGIRSARNAEGVITALGNGYLTCKQFLDDTSRHVQGGSGRARRGGGRETCAGADINTVSPESLFGLYESAVADTFVNAV